MCFSLWILPSIYEFVEKSFFSFLFLINLFHFNSHKSSTTDKINCNICDQILEGLELIDDECDVFGIHMVKIQDPQLAKRYSIKTFPALVYFRNGNPLLFEGDMQNEQSVLEWLIDDDNRELADEIEEVNERMLERLLDESSLLVVFFCKCFFCFFMSGMQWDVVLFNFQTMKIVLNARKFLKSLNKSMAKRICLASISLKLPAMKHHKSMKWTVFQLWFISG